MREEVDAARKSLRGLEDRLDRGGLEERQLGAGAAQQVRDVGGAFVARERGQVVADDDALAERLVHGHADASSQLGLSAEEEAESVLRVHRIVGEQSHLLEHVAAQAVRLVEDEDGARTRLGAQTRHLVLDLPVERGTRSSCRCRR
jgi:hypothetical protein